MHSYSPGRRTRGETGSQKIRGKTTCYRHTWRGCRKLLTDEKRPLHRAQGGDNLSSLARARTLTVLARLEGGRKGSVVRFLYEAGLISKDHTVISLSGANLQRANLQVANLERANLQRADLRKAPLGGAVLNEADLDGANFQEASLAGSVMTHASLRGADLRGASLRVDVSYANGTYEERRVKLFGADLTGAKGIPNRWVERLDEPLLRNATMPNGQKYEDWRKSKGRGEDGENSGPS